MSPAFLWAAGIVDLQHPRAESHAVYVVKGVAYATNGWVGIRAVCPEPSGTYCPVSHIRLGDVDPERFGIIKRTVGDFDLDLPFKAYDIGPSIDHYELKDSVDPFWRIGQFIGAAEWARRDWIDYAAGDSSGKGVVADLRCRFNDTTKIQILNIHGHGIAAVSGPRL